LGSLLCFYFQILNWPYTVDLYNASLR